MAVLGLFAAGCGGSDEPVSTAGSESQEVYLEPVAAAGPAPFTASSATRESAPVQPPLPNPTGRGIRTVNAATPGLYGGTQRLGSCDVEQQVRYLTADEAKARAFAEVSGIEQAKIPDFLRGLTPVVLRADTRVTSHGFLDGRADSFQSVLQAGTAVLVDDHGMPRVRCACGNPLQSPLAPKGSPVHKGDPWSGYQPNQVVVIEPTPHVINNLVIVNIADNTWIERKTGDDGAQDRTPQAVPPYDPADGIPNGPANPRGNTRSDPCLTNSLARTAPPAEPGGPSAPGTPAAPAPLPPAPRATDCPPDRGTSPQARPDTNPNRPSNPRVPQRPPNDLPPDQPGDLPSDGMSDLPSDGMSGLPYDPTSPFPDDPDLPPGPDGTTPSPDEEHDPNAVPDPQLDPPLDPSDPGYPLESA
ncbi:DUF6777 domain-containing protein [Streptomyces sp. NBC_01408]|uniref:DUF6777 domain-containing protein n=1 Tax=Streptomyces sp. NBC_01408 TaxID=2903855 RepID=UPI00224F9BEF|nr:DUF6777 domain-containing protein [Streptomyces sp. NBC_01408]MCX4695601.1 hypothetical protein [Streptomyces sp. NBC_01408]